MSYPVPQTGPPKSPRETLPTMYDLPSENPEEPGLPDEFHDLQPQLLSLTFVPPEVPPSQLYTASDLNFYYDVRHPQWYKRPDWFAVVGVSRLYDEVDLRLSYVVWQEGVNPFVVVELLSPGTESEDLGGEETEGNGRIVLAKPPRKWDVYEKILRVPYYVVFSHYTSQLRVFRLVTGNYQESVLETPGLWMPEIGLGLGIWHGEFLGIRRVWLRWYDAQGEWLLTPEERERQRTQWERQRADSAQAQLELLKQQLRDAGIDPDRDNQQ
ncbi:MAG: Uma2 family endonuclease [Geitlerinemataceae cyanobacterium]